MKKRPRRTRTTAFPAEAAILLLALTSCTAQHNDGGKKRLDPNPVKLAVDAGLGSSDVSPERVSDALRLFVPVEEMTIPGLLHCIRLDGIDAAINSSSEAQKVGKQDVLERLCSQSSFKQAYPISRAYLVPTQHGARFSEVPWSPTVIELSTREAHCGQTLSVLAELGVPATQPIRTSRGTVTLQAVVDDAVANFTYDMELYWITTALAMYLAPQSEWTNKYGHHFSFSEVASRLMSKPVGESSPCGGTHTLYTLAVLLQVHEQHGILETHEAVSEIRRHLKAASAELCESQADSGSWDSLWTKRQYALVDRRYKVRFAKSESHYTWMTGHHLEWQALLPEELRVPRERLVSAANFVLSQMQSREAAVSQPCRYSHGIRAIQLLLGAGEA